MSFPRRSSASAWLVLAVLAASAASPLAAAGIHPVEDELDAAVLDLSARSMQSLRDAGQQTGSAAGHGIGFSQSALGCSRESATGANEHSTQVVLASLGTTDAFVVQIDDVTFPHMDELVRIALGGLDHGQHVLVLYKDLSARRTASLLGLERDLLIPLVEVPGGFFAAAAPPSLPQGTSIVLDVASSSGQELIEVGIGLVVSGETPSSAVERLSALVDDAAALGPRLLPLVGDALSPVPNRVFNAGLEAVGDTVNTSSDAITGVGTGLDVVVELPSGTVHVPPPSHECSIA